MLNDKSESVKILKTQETLKQKVFVKLTKIKSLNFSLKNNNLSKYSI